MAAVADMPGDAGCAGATRTAGARHSSSTAVASCASITACAAWATTTELRTVRTATTIASTGPVAAVAAVSVGTQCTRRAQKSALTAAAAGTTRAPGTAVTAGRSVFSSRAGHRGRPAISPRVARAAVATPSCCPAGTTDAEEQTAGAPCAAASSGAADATGLPRSDAVSATRSIGSGTAVTAAADDQSSATAGTTGGAGHCRRTSCTAVTEEARVTALTAVGALAAVAEEESAGTPAAGRADAVGRRVGAVADQWPQHDVFECWVVDTIAGGTRTGLRCHLVGPPPGEVGVRCQGDPTLYGRRAAGSRINGARAERSEHRCAQAGQQHTGSNQMSVSTLRHNDLSGRVGKQLHRCNRDEKSECPRSI